MTVRRRPRLAEPSVTENRSVTGGGGAPPSHPALIELAKALARLAVEDDIERLSNAKATADDPRRDLRQIFQRSSIRPID